MNKTVGASLLMIGASIGGGMLALPVATASGGFYKAAILLILGWLFMTICSLLVLEVNCWLPEGTNLISMAEKTLGVPGKVLAWISYCLVLYSVLCAYTAGGGDLLHSFFADMHVNVPSRISNIIYVLLLGSIVWSGTHWVDYSNRALMSLKMGTLFIVLLLILPHTNPHKLINGPSSSLFGAALVAATSFTYSIMIPSMRDYLKSDIKQLRIAIIFGSTVPLICYLIWVYAIQSTVNTCGDHGLIKMANGQTVGALTNALSHVAQSNWLTTFAHLFASICMFTTFLAASLALSDFLADGIKMRKHGKQKPVIYGLTFLPVLVILSFYPNIFIFGLKFAGAFCVVLVIILPTLMAWRGRYHRNIEQRPYTVPGGKILLAITFIVGVLVIASNFI